MQELRTESAYTTREEIAHAVTHGLALALSAFGVAILIVMASLRGQALHIVSCTVFGVALVLLYAVSTLYHGVRSPRAKRRLRQLDYSAIFLLIAGTYTPFALVTLRGGWGWTLLAIVWGLALLGIAFQMTLPSKARRLSVPLYLIMGWMAVIALEPLVRALHPGGVLLLVLGGLAYSVGVIFFVWKRLPYNHTVWHVFVMAGSACHFACVLGYVIPAAA
jgi:hemolysin III